jgi:hypothetical protein
VKKKRIPVNGAVIFLNQFKHDWLLLSCHYLYISSNITMWHVTLNILPSELEHIILSYWCVFHPRPILLLSLPHEGSYIPLVNGWCQLIQGVAKPIITTSLARRNVYPQSKILSLCDKHSHNALRYISVSLQGRRWAVCKVPFHKSGSILHCSDIMQVNGHVILRCYPKDCECVIYFDQKSKKFIYSRFLEQTMVQRSQKEFTLAVQGNQLTCSWFDVPLFTCQLSIDNVTNMIYEEATTLQIMVQNKTTCVVYTF